MTENRKSYRIRTGVGNEAPSTINVNLNQTYDIVDVLSLEIDQKNFYKMPAAGYGVIVGRVIANGGFGIPNAKVSVFIPYNRNSLIEDDYTLYHYTTSLSKNSDGIRYNLLPRHLDEECHQDVGSMYEKEYLLDNKDLIQVFDKYYKYTTVTNDGGDYMIYGVPVGAQTVHVDLDLSDIGALSQRPRDMMYKGFSSDMFDSPNKFKKDKNLNNLPQIYSQDNVVNVYPFWGDTTVDETNGVITRCDINIDYTFEPTCVFMGSIVSDTSNRAISQRCVPDDEMGKMSDLVAGEGKIEMIRKTFDGKVEEFSIKSNNLIDGDGVWCYQIPMNLDYVMTDEFGNMVPTDNPSKGIPTRARVRFRISMNETETDDTARKRARFLVPNNPKLNNRYPDFNKTHEADYEFGTFTKEESYRDLFWNKVYTVKSYIPRLQKAKALRRRVHTGIKNVNHAGANNPFPFNNLFIRLTFTYRFLCTLLTLLCVLVYGLNSILAFIAFINYYLAKFLDFIVKPIKWLLKLVPFIGNELEDFFNLIPDIIIYSLLNSTEKMIIKLPNFCDDGNFDNSAYTPMSQTAWTLYDKIFNSDSITIENNNLVWLMGESVYTFPSDAVQKYEPNLGRLFNCIENQLAQDQECTSFNFSNDWVNGVLYAPLWFRKVRKKKKIFFNLIPIPDTDKWCSGNSSRYATGLSLCQTCAQKRDIGNNKRVIKPLQYENVNIHPFREPSPINENTCYGYKCHKKVVSFVNLKKGLIVPVNTTRGDVVYYYKSVEYDNTNLYSQKNDGKGDVKTLFATDIVLLGSLNDCDPEGVPQFFKRLESTTYNMPPNLVQIDYDSRVEKISFEEKPKDDGLLKTMASMMFGDMGMSEIDEEINENVDINSSAVYTDKTGADWGNYGYDQVTNDYRNNRDYIYTTEKNWLTGGYSEFPDVGGLFYGLTCWSAYTKPKSCINISRVCEYGVSLDEAQEAPVYDETIVNGKYSYEHIAPDGFISYDEIYDRDGRAMFATMNGNDLSTKTNPANGFPVYDFMYLYPENFDGSMKNMMQANVSQPIYPSPQNNNYKVEDSSEAYLRFRYGRNREDWSIDYYNSDTRIGLYVPFGSVDAENKNRFPKFENSFYFYFGLNPGNTAIDKFRTLYYSECKDVDGEHAVVDIEFTGNTWCSELTDNGAIMPGDGLVKIDATYLEAPYSVYFANMNGNTGFDVWCKDIFEPKIYFSYFGEMSSVESDGFVWKQLRGIVGGEEQEYGLLNDTYRLTIVDANGDEYMRYIDFTQPAIKANVSQSPFRVKNEHLRNYDNLGHGDFYNNVATLGGKNGGTMSDRNDIGGFIEVTGVNLDGNKLINFMVEIKPTFNINTIGVAHVTPESSPDRQGGGTIMQAPTAYTGSYLEVHQDETIPVIVCIDNTLMRENFNELEPYCPYGYDFPQYPDTTSISVNPYQTNGGNYDFRFGVPVGGKKYSVIVTELCKKGEKWYKSRNSVTSVVEVPEPIEFKMLVNGIDYEIIRNFGLAREIPANSGNMRYGTGWSLLNNGEDFPGNYVSDNFKDYIIGWNDLDNIDGLQELSLIPEGMENEFQWSYDVYIKDTEAKLTNNYNGTTRYNWVEAYVFNPEVVMSSIGKFTAVPDTKQSGVAFIMVLEGNEFVFYKWDENSNTYQQYRPNGVPVTSITTKEYYDYSEIDVKNNFISELNAVTDLRKGFVENVKNSFILKDNVAHSLEITSITNETPVKTLIYYSPDTSGGTASEYYPLNEEKKETVCYGITMPTLTGLLLENWDFKWHDAQYSLKFLGDLGLQPLYGTSEYKKPYLVAVQNSLGETIPEYIKQNHVIGGIDGDINAVAPCMFGVHILDKRLRFVYNTWGCIDEWPYYNERKQFLGGSMSSNLDPKTVSIPGLFSGFALDGTPNYGTDGNGVYREAYFDEQKIGDNNIKMLTLTVNNEGVVEEEKYPVVKFIYNDNADVAVFSDYKFVDNTVDNLLNTEINMSGKKHYVFYNKFTKISVKENDSVYNLSLYGEVNAPSVSFESIIDTNDNTYNGYTVHSVFEDEWCYTFYDGIVNPVYNKQPLVCMQFDSPYMDLGNTGTMYFGDKNFNMDANYTYEISKYYNGQNVRDISVLRNTFSQVNRKFSINGNDVVPITTVYAVRLSKDGQYRAVSKTFDLTQMEYYLNIYPPINMYEGTVSSMVHDITIYINVGVRESVNGTIASGFYYLKNHGFSVQFEDENVGELANVYVDDGYNNNSSILFGQDNCTKWIYFPLKRYNAGSHIANILNFMEQLTNTETCHAYLTDITGLSREMLKVPGVFNHSYCLFNE